jgi:hypothetical protein
MTGWQIAWRGVFGAVVTAALLTAKHGDREADGRQSEA